MWDAAVPPAHGTIGAMWSELRADRVRRDVAAACAEPVSPLELLDRVATLVDRVVPADASCWSTFDPATTMVTSSIGRDLDEHGAAEVRFFELEYALDTPGQYRHLAVAGDGVAVIDAATPVTDDGLDTAALYQHLGTLGVRQQLRVVLHDQGAGWGGAGLMRGPGSPAFDDDEQRFVTRLAPTIAAGVRAALVRATPDAGSIDVPHGPAVLVLDASGVAEATPAATAWLGQLRRTDRGHGELPTVVRAVAASARGGRTVAQRARTDAATWVVLRGAPLGAGRAVVTVEPAAPPEVVTLVGAALGLTARESEVVAEVLRGASTKDIATALQVSRYTVQDHLKSVFAKAGVNSRRELIAQVFFGVYAPRLGTPVRADGFFATP
jgi:DNA-binding CsgD family transcriptional regulator